MDDNTYEKDTGYRAEDLKKEGTRLAQEGQGWLENASPFTLLIIVVIIGILMTTGILQNIVSFIALIAVIIIGYFAFNAWKNQRDQKKADNAPIRPLDEGTV